MRLFERVSGNTFKLLINEVQIKTLTVTSGYHIINSESKEEYPMRKEKFVKLYDIANPIDLEDDELNKLGFKEYRVRNAIVYDVINLSDGDIVDKLKEKFKDGKSVMQSYLLQFLRTLSPKIRAKRKDTLFAKEITASHTFQLPQDENPDLNKIMVMKTSSGKDRNVYQNDYLLIEGSVVKYIPRTIFSKQFDVVN